MRAGGKRAGILVGLCGVAMLGFAGSPASALAAASADLVITGSAPAQSQAGTNIPFTLTVTNNGPNPAASPSLSANVPAGHGSTFTSLAVPAGWTSMTPPAGGNGSVSASAASLASGASATFVLTLHADSGDLTGGLIDVTASIASPTTLDPNGSNNSATPVTTIVNPSAISITATASPKRAAKGEKITYKLTVVNAGPFRATNVKASTSVPGGTKLVSFKRIAGPAEWSAAGATAELAGIFSVAQPTQFALVVKVTKAKAKFTETATALPLRSESDPDLSDNSATVTVCGKSSGGPAAKAAKKGCSKG